MRNEIATAGPAAFLACTPVSVKMPVPMIMPMPNPMRSLVVSRFARPWDSPSTGSFWWMTVSTDFRRSGLPEEEVMRANVGATTH